MAKIGTLIEKLFKKAGIDTTTEELKPIFALDTEVSDDTIGKVDKNLLTIEAAKSNSEVNKALRQSILGVADSKMDELIIELGLNPGEEFANNKNTYEKMVQLTKLALESGKKASSTSNKDDFAKKEADYNKQLKELKDSITTKETEFKNIRDNDLTSFELQKILLGKEYVLPKEMDTNLKVNTALGAVQNELSKKGFSIKRNESGQLVIVNKEGQPAYSDTNEALEPNTFIDGALAQNKLLKINDASQQQQQQASSGATIIQNNKVVGNSAIVAEIEEQLNQFK